MQTFLPLKNQALGQSASTDAPNPVMVVEFEGQKIGLSFDKIIGQQPILIRQLADYISNVPGFSGNTVLANGEPAIILSPKVFAQQYFSKRSRAS
ncbi:MAG: hypothetical protein EOP10_21225 [Proteobacteria bacterium]|nr:MAG: hypothetical protein EOP10_21225 [Pseudomonadota bacterium]